MMFIQIILYFLSDVIASTDCKKRKIGAIEKELAIDRIIYTLNNEGIHIPPVKKNETGFKNDVEDISFSSYSKNLSLINTAHKQLDEDLINYVLDISDQSYPNEVYLNTKSEEQSYKPHVDCVLDNRILDLEYDEFGRHTKLQNSKNCLHNSGNMPISSNLQPKTRKFQEKDNAGAHIPDLDIEPSSNTFLTEKLKQQETTESSRASVRYKSNTASYLKSLKQILYSHDYIIESYSKIINHFPSILTKTYSDWLMVRFNNIKSMIYQIKLSKHKKLDSYKSFIEILDEKIMLLLDKLNVRKHDTLKIYELDDYKSFILILNENLHEMKIYRFVVEYFLNFEEELLFTPFVEFVLLFKFLPDFPGLITLGSLLKHGRDERLLLYFRIIHLIILENESRKELIKPVILFLIKISFMTPKKRTKDLDFSSKEKIDMKKHFEETSICNKDHSKLCFLMWEFHPNKNRTMRYNSKVDGGYVYDVTIFNMEHFRAVVHTYLFQHIMFLEYHNLKSDRWKELFNKSFTKYICAFCLFSEYLDLVHG